MSSSLVGVEKSVELKDRVVGHGKSFCSFFEILPCVEPYLQIILIQKVIVLTEDDPNQQLLSRALLPETILVKFPDVLSDSSHRLYENLSKLLVRIARHFIPTSTLRLLLKSERALDKALPLSFERIALLKTLSSLEESPCFNEFDMSTDGFGCIYSTLKENCYWPPSHGYSFAIWCYVERYSSYSESGAGSKLASKMEHPVRLLTFVDNDIILRAQIIGRKLNLIAGTQSICFDGFTFQCGMWYHIGIVHTKQRLRGSIATLYVNGEPIQTLKLGYLSSTSTPVAVLFWYWLP